MSLFLSACKDAFLNMWEGRSVFELRAARRAAIVAASPCRIAAAGLLWPATETVDAALVDPATRFPHTAQAHHGIADSLRCAADVVWLSVSAGEARRYLDACEGVDLAIERLKTCFAKLEAIFIEDDFLSDWEIARIAASVAPIRLEWRQGLCVDGRYGR
ncbi:hypothetical protein RQP53_09875 [Paucibacter sp. APW11]|uniref:Uncharacterized protein n=1 Tax=Roseateles aquae TaxID=3077235 RepID=A0ABU3PAM5_9BURK|nr:hypothetical protein [Paucibacter sp. APW11]MDT8999572.1 hypothetical protein [Paucibacter sp. APW11]